MRAVENSVLFLSFNEGLSCSSLQLSIKQLVLNIKVVPYTFVSRGVPVGEGTYPEPSGRGVWWPVPFRAVFISPVLPPGTHSLLGEQCASS